MGAELNEIPFHHFISSITNTIWYIDVQKYQSWRKIDKKIASIRHKLLKKWPLIWS